MPRCLLQHRRGTHAQAALYSIGEELGQWRLLPFEQAVSAALVRQLGLGLGLGLGRLHQYQHQDALYLWWDHPEEEGEAPRQCGFEHPPQL